MDSACESRLDQWFLCATWCMFVILFVAGKKFHQKPLKPQLLHIKRHRPKSQFSQILIFHRFSSFPKFSQTFSQVFPSFPKHRKLKKRVWGPSESKSGQTVILDGVILCIEAGVSRVLDETFYRWRENWQKPCRGLWDNSGKTWENSLKALYDQKRAHWARGNIMFVGLHCNIDHR